ncbi:hypothetical protein Q3G72_024137 [Acer saccharum]|nr:hypothetical protein Q3G72_024137 [Acer saccharum]
MKVLIVPGSTSGNSCQEDGTGLAKLHNKALSESLQELERVLEGFRYSYHNFYGSLIKRMNNPEAYGRSQETQVPLFIIGDSLYDPGNNNFLNVTAKANFPPYGETFFKYPTGRFCDGRIIPDFTALHANLSLWRPYLSYQPGKYQFLNGANFASSGASVLPYNDPEVLHLDIQLGFFKNVASLWRQQLGDAEANMRLNNAVFLISIGGVDYFAFSSDYLNATESEKQEYVNWVIGNITFTITPKKFNQVGCIAGNNNFLNVSASYKADYPPYGESFFDYPTGRVSNGRVIPDFIALHANLSLWTPYLSDQPRKRKFLNGANFASAGATVLPFNDPDLLHLDIQLAFFKNVANLWRQELGNAEANKRLNNAVFLISIGGVDYFLFPSDKPNATESEKHEYVNWVIGNITNTITAIVLGEKEISKVMDRDKALGFDLNDKDVRMIDVIEKAFFKLKVLRANLSLWRPYLDQPGKHQFLNGANFASAGASVLPYNDPEVV